MAERTIDYDRGVIINSHQQTGMDVFMYVDQPGTFLTAHGLPVPDSIAREAGFPVDVLMKERMKLERKAQANALIDKELSDDANIVEKELSKSKSGFVLVSLGLGRHNVKDPDGNVLNAHPMPKESAQKLFDAMSK